MTTILLDTNILLYTITINDERKRLIANDVLKNLQETQRGCLSAQNLAEFANVAIRKFRISPNELIPQIQNLRLAFLILDLTPPIVLEAVRGVRDYQLSYYDAQIWATAKLYQLPCVFSEDFNSGHVLEGIRFVNPFANSFQLKNWL